MATWLTHLRVADRIFDKIHMLNGSLFFAGSIAPDTNISPDVSHWCSNGDKTTCYVDDFYIKHIINNDISTDMDFYLGYYVHLMTDVLWQKQKIKPLMSQGEEYIRVAKQKWKIVDYEFLKNQSNLRPLIAMQDTDIYLKKWFDYYSISQVRNLVEHVLFLSKTIPTEIRNIDIVAKNEIEQFIEDSSNIIFCKLKEVKM